jgi:hypothetical protein
MPPVSRFIGEGGREAGLDVVAINGFETSPIAVPACFGNRLFVGELRATEFSAVASEEVNGVFVSDLDRCRVGVLGLLGGMAEGRGGLWFRRWARCSNCKARARRIALT